MKAIHYYQYGSPTVLKYEDAETPVPGDHEVLLRVHAASVNPYDWHFMRGLPYFLRIPAGLREPKDTRLGTDVAGEVVAVGAGITRFKPGDAVFGTSRGAFAEYACTLEANLAAKPQNVNFEHAASAPIAGLTALQGLRDTGNIQPRQKVLINGASGGVGTFAVQIAKSFGAEVTGVSSGGNVEMVRSIGADHAIDYTREDFTRGTERYDLILDCVGNHSLNACRRALKREGTYVAVGAPSGRWMLDFFLRVMQAQLLSRFVPQKLIVIMTKPNHEDLATIGNLISAGKLKPVVDRRYSLEQVPEAMRYVETGHARGKVVVVGMS